MVKVTAENDLLKVKSPYNSKFISRAKNLGGKWESPYWVFPTSNEEAIRKLLMEIYWEDGNDVNMVTLIADFSKNGRIGKELLFGNIILATRRDRDARVSLSDNVYVLKGEFSNKGGSFQHPKITWEEEITLQFNVPENYLKHIEDFKSNYESVLVNVKEISQEKALTKEELLLKKAKLLEEIDEIDEILNKM